MKWSLKVEVNGSTFQGATYLLTLHTHPHYTSRLASSNVKESSLSSFRCADQNYPRRNESNKDGEPTMSEFHTDSLRPSSLPTASLGRRQTSTANVDKDADAELDKVAEEWNLRIDKEMKNLTGGLGELVELADVRLLSFLCSPH
jgi:hypothetical protein